MSINRDFTGVFIPAHIWLSREVKPMEKLLLAEITALSQRTGWCYATRRHFAEWMDCTETNVTNYLTRLVKLGYIEQVERPGQPTLRRVNNQMFYGQQDPVDMATFQSKGSATLTVGVSHSDPQGSVTVTPLNISNKYNNKREDTPSLQAQQISPVPKSETQSETQSEQQTKSTSVIPSVVSSVPTSVISSDLKEESAAGQRAGAAVSGAADSSAYHSQREAYRTDSELRTIMAAYYKGNPNEYTVGILNDAKGSRMTTDQLKDCMTMWASYMIENQKFNHSAHQLHQSFKRWVLRETEYKRTTQANAKQGQQVQAETVTLKTKGFTFQ